MAEKDASSKLRKAVKENNLFLVKRLIQRTDMRNADPAQRRYTSLAWAAVQAHEEIFEFLLTAGHDDEELSKDSENDTILMLLADFKPPPQNPYAPGPSQADLIGAAIRMARLYYHRYPWILDWSNLQGKTALHMAALKGNEELVRMLCDWGADFDLADNGGNTPLHYASAWGHIPVVQLLIERGCQFTARNNDGFTASDYAYSFSTRDTLQDSARSQFETNKKSRLMVYAQAAARGHERGAATTDFGRPPSVPLKNHVGMAARMRSGSGTTTTSDSGDVDGVGSVLRTSQSSLSSSTSQPHGHAFGGQVSSVGSRGTFSLSSPGPSQLSLPPVPPTPTSSLSPIVNRMRERDADEMEKYKRRNRSGSGGTSSTDNKSQVALGPSFTSAGPSANGDDITALSSLAISGSTNSRRRLRPSVSAAQLRSESPIGQFGGQVASSLGGVARNRAGTNPGSTRAGQGSLSSVTVLSRTASSDASRGEERAGTGGDAEVGGGTQNAAEPVRKPMAGMWTSSPGPGKSRRLPFNLLSKPTPPPPPPPLELSDGHRRESSAASVRG